MARAHRFMCATRRPGRVPDTVPRLTSVPGAYVEGVPIDLSFLNWNE